MPNPNKPILLRLLDKIQVAPSGCWLWTGAVDSHGYGKLNMRRNWLKAHRISYLVFHGIIPPGAFICHTCDNPPCINPFHLYAGSPADNTRDRVARNRSVGLPGAANPSARLTEDQVIEILALGRTYTQRQIGKMYGISAGAVHLILTGKTWKHLTAAQPILALRDNHILTLSEMEHTS